MNILVSIVCWNTPGILKTAINAVLNQTVKVKEILVVDNGSTQPLQSSDLPNTVTLVRNQLNLGASGGAITGFEYARSHECDWIWILDADSNPSPDTLERLIELLHAMGPDWQNKVGIVSPTHHLANIGQLQRGRRLTPGGPRVTSIPQDKNFISCECVIWSGSLINMAAVATVGLPRAGTNGCWEDFSNDYGDIEFTHRIHKAGYQIVVHCDSIMEHTIGRGFQRRILGRDFHTPNYPPFRRYLYFRNLVYFWLRLYPERNWPRLLMWFSYRVGITVASIVLLEQEKSRKLQACFTGIRDGLLGRLDRNFDTPV